MTGYFKLPIGQFKIHCLPEWDEFSSEFHTSCLVSGKSSSSDLLVCSPYSNQK